MTCLGKGTKKEDTYRIPKVITVKDLDEMNQSAPVHPNDIKKQGLRCLVFSNKFRNEEGKSELLWNQQLYEIGRSNSI